MALITCKECGNKISDTVDICIHCGSSLKVGETVIPKETVKAIRYESFTEQERWNLELEFLNESPRATKFIRKLEGPRAHMTAAYFPFLIMVIAFIACMVYITNRPSGKIEIQSAMYLFIGVAAVIILLVCNMIIFITGAIRRAVLQNSIQSHMYLKQYQVWLRDRKGISFVPLFANEKQKYIFESLDDNDILDR